MSLRQHIRSRPKAFLPVSIVGFVAGCGLVLQGSSGGHRALLSADLLSHEAKHTAKRVRVIVRGSPAEVTALAERHHVAVVRTIGDLAVLVANSAEVSDLARDPAVHHLSGDMLVRSGMSVSSVSTGADKVRAGSATSSAGAIAAVSGDGIGVAVLDSGVSRHAALTNVVASISFVTGNTRVTDEFGHGTHVAGIVGGSATAAKNVTSLFNGGIAPRARIINVRVLGPDGTGLTSDVIAGMEWAIDNRARYNIRVINLSLGHPVTEPAATDPLCREVKRATAAGIVVVAAAGNAGKAPDGSQILGGIESPGNSPYAITVGALNTWQTIGRSDDSVATYSSRGPTRYDLAVKPDIVAPGNKIVSLEADGSYLSSAFSSLHVAGGGRNAYFRLSGTSMAAPMVSGAVALLLEGNPGSSVAQIKLALQAGATYLPDAGLLGGGTGSVDFWRARQTTANGLDPSVTHGPGGPSGMSFWDRGTLMTGLYDGLRTRQLSARETLLAWLNPSLLHWGELNLIHGSVNVVSSMAPHALIWGEAAGWSGGTHIMWGDTIAAPEGQHIMWGDTELTNDSHIMWGDTVLASPDPH